MKRSNRNARSPQVRAAYNPRVALTVARQFHEKKLERAERQRQLFTPPDKLPLG